MKSTLVISYLMYATVLSFSQSANTQMGARIAGLGNASAAITDDASFFNNVGAMAFNHSSSFFSYEAVPSLEGANRMATAIQLPVLKGIAGIGVFKFGDDFYSQQMASLGFSNQMGHASLGFKVNYLQYQAPGYGVNRAASLDFGGLAQITPQIAVGAYIINLTQSRITAEEYLPTRLVAGISFKPSSDFIVATEIDKDLLYPATWKTGFEYNMQKKVFFRSGFNLNPSALYAGMGISFKRLKIDYAFKFNRLIGSAHQGSATIRMGKESKK